MKHVFVGALAGLLYLGCLPICSGQAPGATTATGCAMPLEGQADFLTLCEPDNCSLLRGAVDRTWAGHTVTLRGTLRAATSTQPRTLEVQHVVRVGAACSAVCRPSIPGRGFGPKDKPSGEGGTPGVTAPKPQP